MAKLKETQSDAGKTETKVVEGGEGKPLEVGASQQDIAGITLMTS